MSGNRLARLALRRSPCVLRTRRPSGRLWTVPIRYQHRQTAARPWFVENIGRNRGLGGPFGRFCEVP